MKEPRCEDCRSFHKFEERHYYNYGNGWELVCEEAYCCTMLVETEKDREHQTVVKVKPDEKCEMFQEI